MLILDATVVNVALPSIKTDLINAGGRWVDREVVEDGNLITSRGPQDLSAFCEAFLRQLDQYASRRGATATASDLTH